MFNLCCFPHCSRSTVWKGSAFSQQSQKVITMCNLMDFVFLIRICTCTKFLSVHVLKLNHFLIQRDSFKCKIPSNYLKSLSLLCLLGTAHKMQNTDPNTRLFLAPSASIAMFPVRELLLRCPGMVWLPLWHNPLLVSMPCTPARAKCLCIIVLGSLKPY